MKLFGVGLNKTGTRSLHEASRLLGLKAQHWEPKNFANYSAGRFEHLFVTAETFDCLTDWPWPLMVEQLVDRFGSEARFVLTRRARADTWFASIASHAAIYDNEQARRIRETIFGAGDPVHAQACYLAHYEAHNQRIRSYFHQAGLEHRLLDVAWDTGDGWPELCGFLGKAVPAVPFPHCNKGDGSDIAKTTDLPARGAVWPALPTDLAG